MELVSEIKIRINEIEEILAKYLPKEEGPSKLVMEAMNYSLLSGGKRLRPMLMLETYRMYKGGDGVVEPFLAAIEMIHTYSLIHDDLPAMDDDELRRGRKTNHVVYGEAMAILAGDGLLNYAFETAMKAFALSREPERIARALQVLAKKAGIHGMLGGQVVDVQNEGNSNVDEATLSYIYRLKTGALLEASMMIGGILAGADASQVHSLEKIAADVGMAFQIQDDILDVEGSREELGKPIGSDIRNQKVTYVTLHGIREASEKVVQLTDAAVRNLDSLPVENEFLRELLLGLIHRRN